MVFWTTRWTAQVSGSKIKEIKCESCEKLYRFKIERTAGSASGGPYGIYGNAGARRSFISADENLTGAAPRHARADAGQNRSSKCPSSDLGAVHGGRRGWS